MSNHHLRDRNLSYKAKGLLSFMLFLPDDWDYSLAGLCSISKESRDGIRSILKELKSFYMKQMPDGTVAGADLEMPRIGEVFGMSQREEDLDKLVSRMKELDMKIDEYEWYLKLRKYGTCEISGFGIGFERLLMFITGMDSIKDVTPYPRSHKSCDY